MTPKEKANELGNKMFNGSVFDYKSKEEVRAEQNRAKQCALIAVEEILRLEEYLNCFYVEEFEYWHEVKTEIETL